jgi:endonuclease YncB( thermonuclease family)
MAKSFLSILLLLLLFSPGLSQAFMGKVVGVADGDTVTVLAEGNTIKGGCTLSLLVKYYLNRADGSH